MNLSQAYKAGLESAAKVVEDHYWDSLEYEGLGKRHGQGIAAAIRALPVPEDAGDMAMVPRKPTDKMLSAGHAAMEKVLGYMIHQPVIPDIYRAMINAKE